MVSLSLLFFSLALWRIIVGAKPRMSSPERVLEFDLSGLPRREIDMEYLDGLAKVLRFEGILKYVALPQLVYNEDKELRITENTAGGAKMYSPPL
jgi:hypothetical protein